MNTETPPITWEMLRDCHHPFQRKELLNLYYKWLTKQRKKDRRFQQMARSKMWQLNNFQKFKEIKRKWRNNNPGKIKEYKRKYANTQRKKIVS